MKKTQFYKLFGGLGNQLFQYAYGIGKIADGEKVRFILNKDASTKNNLSINELFTVDNSLIISPKTKFSLFFYKFFAKYILKTWHADFFQNYNFAENLKIFSPPANEPLAKIQNSSITENIEKTENAQNFQNLQNLSIFNFKKIENYEKTEESKFIKEKNAVSLHIRGGDYNRIDVFRDFGNICNLEYYRNAIKIICNEMIEPVFVIFSNDNDFAQNFVEEIKKDEFFIQNKINLVFLDEISKNKNKIVQNNSTKSKKDDAFEIYLQSICKANIIANSTFSWWGAFFNQNPQKIVISPKKWHNFRPKMIEELVPDRCNWRKI